MPKYKFGELVYNITEKRAPVEGDEELYIGLEHLDSGSLRVTRWGSKVALKGDKLKMKAGDILFGRRNTYLRRVAVAPHDGLFSAHGMIFRANTAHIDEDYLLFFIASDCFMDAAIRISVGSLSPTVNWKELKELEFTIPDLDAQRETVQTLLAANDLKEKYEELLAKTDELVKSQFIELIQPLIESGETVPMMELVQKERPITYGILKPGTNVEGGVPVVRVKDYPNGEIIQEDMLHTTTEIDSKYVRSHLLPGDLLLSIGGSIGRMAIVPTELEGANITQHTARLSLSEKVLPKYVMGVLEMPALQHIIESQVKGVAQKGSGTFITNPGNVFSEPVITVSGSGEITLIVGMTIVELSDVDGEITIDSTLQEAYSGYTSMNNCMSGDFPTLPPGSSTISWTGNVTYLTVTPNWRNL